MSREMSKPIKVQKLSVSRLVLGTVNQRPRGNNGATSYLGCLISQNFYFPLHLYLIFCYEGIKECYRYKPLKFYEKVSYPLLALRKIDKQLAYQPLFHIWQEAPAFFEYIAHFTSEPGQSSANTQSKNLKQSA